jgi:cobalamin biosynthesis protein CobT
MEPLPEPPPEGGEGKPSESEGESSESEGEPSESEGEPSDSTEDGDSVHSSAPDDEDVGDSGSEEGSEPSDITDDSEESSETTDSSEDSEEEPDDTRDSEGKPPDSEAPEELPDIEDVDLPDDFKPLTKVIKEDDLEKRGSCKYVPWTRSETIRPRPRYARAGFASEIHSIAGASTVSKRIKRYLKIASKEAYLYGTTSGKIHPKNIHRIYNGTENPRIFKQKTDAKLKTDTAVTLLIDCSGSMKRNRKYYTACACAVAIASTLKDLHIPCEILGFSENEVGLLNYIFKDFSENITRSKLVDVMSSSDVSLNQNADGESLLWAAERLFIRKEKNKLLIVLSDGEPCGYYYGDGRWYLKQVCETIEKSKQIDLVGIGVLTDAVRRYYENWVVVEDIADLDEVLFEALKRNLLT